MSVENIHRIVIVGSGPAGLTAAIYAARANLQPLVIEGMQAGGQLVQTAEVENFPGFELPITGMDLMARMRKQAERCGVQFLMDEVERVDLQGPVKKLETMMNGTLEAQSVIFALGAAARWTGLAGEKEYRNHGVSACATCDGAFYRGKDVAVIGGGNTALGDALYLAKLCRSVTIIHRRDSFRAAKVLADRVATTANIRVLWDSVVDEFLGEARKLTSLRVKSVKTGDMQNVLVSGAFVAIGAVPCTNLLAGQVELDDLGYVQVTRQQTSVAGVFAAGDCADGLYKQAVVAAGSGAVAALEAEKYLLLNDL